MAHKQKTTRQQIGIWVPVTILLVGILTTVITISRKKNIS